MRKKNEWDKDCMSRREIEVGPGAKTIGDPVERDRLADRKRDNSEYFLMAAKNLLESNTPSGVYILGHLAVEKKVEQALAIKGYKVNTHICTIKGLSRVLEEKELSKSMDRIYKLRQDVNYETEITEETDKAAEDFMDERVNPFLKEMERKIKDMKD